MLVSDILNSIREEINRQDDVNVDKTYKEALWLSRINQTVKRLLREGFLWNVTDQLTLATGTSTITLPTYFLVFRKDTFDKIFLKTLDFEDNAFNTIEVSKFDIQDVVIEDAPTPNSFAVLNNKTLAFDVRPENDIKVFTEFYRTLENPLVKTDDFQDQIEVWDEVFEMYLVDIMFMWQSTSTVKMAGIIAEYAEEMRYLREKEFFDDARARSAWDESEIPSGRIKYYTSIAGRRYDDTYRRVWC